MFLSSKSHEKIWEKKFFFGGGGEEILNAMAAPC